MYRRPRTWRTKDLSARIFDGVHSCKLSYTMSATFSTGVRVVAKPAQRASAARAPVAVVANLQKVRGWAHWRAVTAAALGSRGARGSRTGGAALIWAGGRPAPGRCGCLAGRRAASARAGPPSLARGRGRAGAPRTTAVLEQPPGPRRARRRSRSRAAAQVASFAVAGAASLFLAASANAATTIKLGGDGGELGFYPPEVTIAKGETVTWCGAGRSASPPRPAPAGDCQRGATSASSP